ncbi:hypothetical protein [Dysgonomonas sp. 25]|uniref:LIC_10190 family membrane protein n=1 Tax=Dysgonomonas sp. 25 TaxID=2302933 RepID=UPI0013D13A96|nr:hypothetical protein [Dysgonomonas sp. 25]NDV67287.1 hypothetical protein [Dysgonomonas sp. 25]
MVAILLSFIVISFVLFTYGDMFVLLYRKVCKQDEHYNILDTALIGMTFVTAVITLTSLFLPTNQYILLALLVLGVIYWMLNRGRIASYTSKIKNLLSSFSKVQLALLLLSLLVLLVYMLWASHWFDATYYHYQNIRWNEEYRVVPGLGNLEHRFGFNSNFFLLSALFSFRFLFGEAIYGLQFTLMVILLCWVLVELVRSRFELKRILLLLFYFFFFVLNIESMTDSSTDFVSNFCIFYLVSRLILYPQVLKDSKLLYYIIPVILITFKLSVAPFFLFGLYILIHLLRKKDYRLITTFITLSVVLVVPWIIRTVVITGYLFFPVSGIDIFGFDWKVPEEILQMEVGNVTTFAGYVFGLYFKFDYFKLFGWAENKFLLIAVLILLVNGICILLSTLLVAYKAIKKRKSIPGSYWCMYLVLFANLLYWYNMAPDPRFAYGVIFGLSLLSIVIILPQKEYYYPRLGKLAMLAFAFVLLFSSFKRVYNYYMLVYPTSLKDGRKPFSSILIQPYSSMNQAEAKGIHYKPFTIYKLGELDIYMSADKIHGVTYDMLPATSLFPIENQVKFQNIETVEARGTTLQDGFRPKKGYTE